MFSNRQIHSSYLVLRMMKRNFDFFRGKFPALRQASLPITIKVLAIPVTATATSSRLRSKARIRPVALTY